MTNKKAIDRFKDEIAGQGFYNDNEHREFAIKALEKQIPKKPFEQDPNHLCGHCPDCGHLVKRWMNNCPNCGKALDWSKE